jgi:hypothetical protein
MKFCINCQYYTSFKNTTDDGYCSRPQLGINLVNGEKNTKVCSGQRQDTDAYSICGKNAQYFELKVVA